MDDQQNGFSLIELLITLAIISILAAIIYPSYTIYVIKTRRTQAQVALINMAAKLEQYYLLHDSYKKANFSELNMKDQTDSYRLEMQVTDNTYMLSAIPIKQQSKDECGTLLYDQTGQKSATGSSDCW